MKVIILAHGNPYLKNPYLSKFASVLDSMRVPHEFWIWRRDTDRQPLPNCKTVLRFGSWGGGAVNALGYLLWVSLLTVLIFCRPRAGVYFCSRLDAAVPCALVSLLRRCQFVFLDADTLSKSYAWPRPVKRLIEALEHFVGKRTMLHVVPGESRITSTEASKVRILLNTPHSDVIEEARKLAGGRSVERGKLRVLVSGLISAERGAGMLRAVVESVDRKEIEFVAAGRLLGDDAKRMAEALGDNYLGIVTNEEALALLLGCDLAVAFYDPSLEINRLAEPNKWFDCAALHVPFVTNHGLETSAPFIEAGACFVCDYGDADGLKRLLDEMAASPELLEQRRQGLRTLQYEPWDVGMSRIIAECEQLSAFH